MERYICYRCDSDLKHYGHLRESRFSQDWLLCEYCWADDDKIGLVTTPIIGDIGYGEMTFEQWQQSRIIELLDAINDSIGNLGR